MSARSFLSWILCSVWVVFYASSQICFAEYNPLINQQNIAPLQAQIVQDDFVFNKTTVLHAALIEKKGKFVGLEIKLKSQASELFEKLASDNIGKVINIVYDERIVSSARIVAHLSGHLQITGITKTDAEAFLKFLNST